MVFKKGNVGYWKGKKRKKETIEKRKQTMIFKYGKLLGRKKTTIVKMCLICNKFFDGPRWSMKKRRFCSPKCAAFWNRGENNPAKRPEVREKITRKLSGRKLSKVTKEKKRLEMIEFYKKNPNELNRFVNSGKKNRPQYSTPQGFLVRSRAEQKIAEWFYDNKIECLYEMIIVCIDRFSFIPDFFLPQYKTFVEYYGNFRGDNSKTKLKRKMYKDYDVDVIQIEDISFKDIKGKMGELFEKGIVNLSIR